MENKEHIKKDILKNNISSSLSLIKNIKYKRIYKAVISLSMSASLVSCSVATLHSKDNYKDDIKVDSITQSSNFETTSSTVITDSSSIESSISSTVTSEPKTIENIKPKNNDMTLSIGKEGFVGMYHKFPNKIKYPDLEITPDNFRKQITSLKEDGYTFGSIEELCDFMQSKTKIPEKRIYLTFDDAFVIPQSVIDTLIDNNAVATIAINTKSRDFKGNPVSPYSPATWEQLKRYSQIKGKDGNVVFYFASHTVTHINFNALLRNKSLSQSQIEDTIRVEIRDSKKIIEEQLNIKCDDLFLPYGSGENDETIKRIAKEEGYISIETVSGGLNLEGGNLMRILRYGINCNDTADTIEKKIEVEHNKLSTVSK